MCCFHQRIVVQYSKSCFGLFFYSLQWKKHQFHLFLPTKLYVDWLFKYVLVFKKERNLLLPLHLHYKFATANPLPVDYRHCYQSFVEPPLGFCTTIQQFIFLWSFSTSVFITSLPFLEISARCSKISLYSNKSGHMGIYLLCIYDIWTLLEIVLWAHYWPSMHNKL